MKRDSEKLLSFVGDFWSSSISRSQLELIRQMVHTSDFAGDENFLDVAVGNLTSAQWALCHNLLLPWNPSAVTFYGPYLGRRQLIRWGESDGTSHLLTLQGSYNWPGGELAYVTYETEGSEVYVETAGGCREIVSVIDPDVEDATPAESLIPLWSLPISADIRPVVIMGSSRPLTAGIDFESLDGLLVFREDPSILLDEAGVIECLVAWRRNVSTFSFPLGVDRIARPDIVARFYRSAHSAHALGNAAAVVAGINIPEQESEVTHVATWCDDITVYHTTSGIIESRLPHTTLTIGDTIPADSLLEGGVRWGSRPNGNPGRWWREFDWGQGIALSQLCPAGGSLIVPNGPLRIVAHSEDAGGLHVRPWFSGTDADREIYWAWLLAVEKLGGVYLNEVLELTTVGEEITVNGVDFVFENLLSDRAVVIELDAGVLRGAPLTRCLEFLREHRMVGTVTIITQKNA